MVFIKKLLCENIYVLIGILFGLYMSSCFNGNLQKCKDTNENSHSNKVNLKTAQHIINNSVNKFATNSSLNKKVSGDTKKGKLVRPRYYSTELGIKEKLFIGIFTSEDKVNTQALHINKTIGHLVDKIKFFITAQYKLKTKFNLTGLVGFTDARDKYRPFQVIKYVSDTYLQDYDYYFFTQDYTYVNIHKLKESVSKISVSMDVYLGTKVSDGSYCSLNGGILLSNSVMAAMRAHLDWCIMNAVSDDASENIGRCVHHSIGLSCQDQVQDESIPSFKLKHFELNSHLLELSKLNKFNTATTVYPVLHKNDIYLLNAYFIKLQLGYIQHEVNNMSGHLGGESWPPGQREGARPATRFDLPRQHFFNMTHVFFPDDFTNVRPHTDPELKDIKNVLLEVKCKVASESSDKLQFRRLINGYRVFDLSRGMDYTLDLGFKDTTTGKETIKRFEVSKPLAGAEFVSVPYVTENSRVTALLPVQETDLARTADFLNMYAATVMDSKEKTFLMMVFLYQFDSSSKGADDVFGEIKTLVTKMTSKYKGDVSRIGWVSIRLPESSDKLLLEENQSLNFAVVDLALKKIGLDSLTFILDVNSIITVDFLNRVRMNTILGAQVFSPIPFRQFDPKVSEYPHLDVHKSAGHFDRENYKFLAFYGKDYVTARKKHQREVPLIRIDNDISNILSDDFKSKGNIFEMFLKYAKELHCMRATEMNLKVKHYLETDDKKLNKFLGNEAQLAKLILSNQDKIPNLL